MIGDLYQSLSEAVTKPFAYQARAEAFYKGLERFLGTFGAHRAWRTQKGPRGSLVLALPAIVVDPKLVDLEIIFAPLSLREFSSSYGKRGTTILLSVLPPGQDVRNIQAVDIKNHRDAVVHEFSHYLYRKERPDGNGTFDQLRAGRWKKYVNAPQEFNAYYQQGLDRLMQSFRQALQSHPGFVREILRDSFQAFHATALRRGYWRDDFLRGLNRQHKLKMRMKLRPVYRDLVQMANSKMGGRWA